VGRTVNNWTDIISYSGEESKAQTLENSFFNIFGMYQKKAVIFEKKEYLQGDSRDGQMGLFSNVSEENNTSNSSGYINLFWQGYGFIKIFRWCLVNDLRKR
jgi:hypothetical protein